MSWNEDGAGTYETLKVDRLEPGLLVVALDRPAVRNAIDTVMMRELGDLFRPLADAPGDLRCVILTGAGEAAFSAGVDLKERQGLSDEAWRAQHALIEEAVRAILDASIPVIAAVNGAAFGGGCELALACDFVLAARTARFAQPEAARGIMPGAGGTQTLPRAVGTRRAKQILLTGEPFTADEALTWGLANEVLEPAALMPRALEVARAIARNAPVSVREIKWAVDRGTQTDLGAALAIELEAYDRTVETEDRMEGVKAFNEKRAPRFKGR